MPNLKDRVRETYRKFYRETRDSTEAWNKTLDALSPFGMDADEKVSRARQKLSALIREIAKQVELDEGDPYRLAIREAMALLRSWNVVSFARSAYDNFYKMVVDEVRRAAGFLKSKDRKQDWSPRNIPMQGDTPPKSIEEALERTDPPSLYIPFSEDGQARGMFIDHPDYFRGWGATTAAVLISADLGEEDIERAVQEALGELDIWDQETDTA